MADAPYRDLADLALTVASEAAALIHDAVGGEREVATKSTATDLVTEMDRRAEVLIADRLLGARPDDGIVGEEGASETGSTGVRWIVDPIDGTTNYFYGHPGYCVSIAAEVGGDLVAGAVVDPAHGDRFAAALGTGATRNGTPLGLDPPPPLERALIATGFGYDPDRRRHQAAVLGRLIGSIRDIRRMGAAAVDLCSVAAGRVDGYYERGLALWDLAAGAVVAREAGARVETLDGSPLGTDGSLLVAAHPRLWDDLATLVARSEDPDER